MIGRFILCVCALSLAGLAGLAPHANAAGAEAHAQDEPRPYTKNIDPWPQVDAAFSNARRSGKRVILAMGANWCHDSRSLAAKFETPQLQALISEHFELVYIDVGNRDKNTDIAKVYGMDKIVGTPTVLVLSPGGDLLNASTAPTWRNAANRTSADTFTYFSAYAAKDPIASVP